MGPSEAGISAWPSRCLRGWIAGPAGPPPSQFGDYVLGTLVPEGENTGTVVITAQDHVLRATRRTKMRRR